MDFYRKPALDHLQQIGTPPAHDFVGCKVGTPDDQFVQFGHLWLCQKRRPARDRAGFQPFDTLLIVPMNPIAQCLPIHPVGRSGPAARMTVQNHRQSQQTANLRAVAALAGKQPKRAAGVISPSNL